MEKVFLDTNGSYYLAEAALSPLDCYMPFVSDDLRNMLRGEPPLPSGLVNNLLDKEQDTPGYIAELKKPAPVISDLPPEVTSKDEPEKVEMEKEEKPSEVAEIENTKLNANKDL